MIGKSCSDGARLASIAVSPPSSPNVAAAIVTFVCAKRRSGCMALPTFRGATSINGFFWSTRHPGDHHAPKAARDHGGPKGCEFRHLGRDVRDPVEVTLNAVHHDAADDDAGHQSDHHRPRERM